MSRWKSPPTRYNRSRLGYTQDFLVESVMRNATINRIYEGTNRIQRVVIVAGAAALILAAFGFDSVPEAGGRGARAFGASLLRDGVPGALRRAAVPRWAAGGVGMKSAPAGFVVWVRPLENLCGDARQSSHGPPDRTRRSHGAGRRTIPDDSPGISAVNTSREPAAGQPRRSPPTPDLC
jgi:hypothetical protein